ncbi:MAG: helix-turn-helix domain-containing protein [Desulfobacterium sp.]|nr:helix-turn-helix domain-containing protein [Desulfobacterium sp.]MBU3948082.1 helix-turn-helix domain-containing protein [Pseudomonadota bacterium]MBU4035075.1 helix-turn-helix domain-containing protein [Pseudomonadota bacterium]
MVALRGTNSSYNNPKLYKSLGSLIKDYRQWRGLSQEYVSELIGVSVRQFRNWEANRRSVRMENLHDLSELTGIPMQVCVALNADQPLWYSLQKRWFAYSSVVAQSLPNELFKSTGKLYDDLTLTKEKITTDKQYKMVLSCHHDIYRTLKPLKRDVVEKASMIVPDLNFIIYDSWGHYVGHSIWLPIKKDVYAKLKKQESLENYLAVKSISDIITLKDGVFLFISSYISSLNVAYYKLIESVRSFAEVGNKERYLIAMYTAMTEVHELFSTIGMRIVGSYKQERSEVYNKLYEAELDFSMRPGGPWDWLLEEYKIKKENGLIKAPDSKKLPAIELKTSNNSIEILEKYSSDKINGIEDLIVDDASDVLIVDRHGRLYQPLERHKRSESNKFEKNKDNELGEAACPNADCPLYGIKGKGNVVSNGTYHRKGKKTGRRFLCKKCRKSFCNRTGTVFYDLRSPEENVTKALRLLAEGKPLCGVKKELGVNFRTVRRWLNIASLQFVEINGLLRNELNMSEVEINALLTNVKKIFKLNPK